jgi:hypothetical protein
MITTGFKEVKTFFDLAHRLNGAKMIKTTIDFVFEK